VRYTTIPGLTLPQWTSNGNTLRHVVECTWVRGAVAAMSSDRWLTAHQHNLDRSCAIASRCSRPGTRYGNEAALAARLLIAWMSGASSWILSPAATLGPAS
jgi:hypothetical protein